MAGVKRNFIYLSLYKVLEMLLPMITSPLLSRKLGADALGIYTYTYSIASVFVMFAELGVYRYGMREIAKVRDDKSKLNQIYSDIYSTHLFCGGVVFVIYILFVITSVKNNVIIYIIQAGCLISNMLDNAFFYVGIEDVKTLSLRDALIKICTFILIIVVIKSPEDLVIYTIIMVISSIIGKFIALIYARKYVRMVKPNVSACVNHLKPMAVLMVPALAAVIYQSMDRIMIGRFYNNADVGYYDCASKALIPKNIITALGTVLCPGIAKAYAEGKRNQVNETFKNSMRVSVIMSLAFMFGISAIAKEFAPFFWGKDFSICSKYMIGLSISLPVWCVGEVVRNQYLLPCGKDNEYMFAFLIGVAVNAILNFILIPITGATGAIIATICAELVMSAVQAYFIRKEILIKKILVTTIPYFLIGCFMLFVVRNIAKILTFMPIICIVIEVIVGASLFTLLSFVYEIKSQHKCFILLFDKMVMKR